MLSQAVSTEGFDPTNVIDICSDNRQSDQHASVLKLGFQRGAYAGTIDGNRKFESKPCRDGLLSSGMSMVE